MTMLGEHGLLAKNLVDWFSSACSASTQSRESRLAVSETRKVSR